MVPWRFLSYTWLNLSPRAKSHTTEHFHMWYFLMTTLEMLTWFSGADISWGIFKVSSLVRSTSLCQWEFSLCFSCPRRSVCVCVFFRVALEVPHILMQYPKQCKEWVILACDKTHRNQNYLTWATDLYNGSDCDLFPGLCPDWQHLRRGNCWRASFLRTESYKSWHLFKMAWKRSVFILV